MTTPLTFAVVGSPVAHSKSPRMHGAAYRALGLPHRYEKLETSAAELELRVASLRAGEVAGLNVTVPHKRAVLTLVDALDPSASATGAANTLVRDASGLVRAYNTDAPALRDELVRVAGGDAPRFVGRTAVVLGTGGAARAAIFALGQLGVAHVVVRGRRVDDGLAAVLAASRASSSLSFESLSARPTRDADLVAIVQATTAGMDGSGVDGSVARDAVAWEGVPDDCVVYDVVYAPSRTPLVLHAASLGLAVDSGLGMLARQGALAFELWLGTMPPLDVMLAAIA